MKETLNIVLLGKTCNGKSSTGNTLLNRKAFQVSCDKTSCTTLPLLEVSDIMGVRLKVVDTPGLMDTSGTRNEDTILNVCCGMSLCPDGFDALVLVLDYNNIFSTEEPETIRILKTFFGECFVRDYCVVVITHGDNFDLDRSEDEKPISFKEWCLELKHPVGIAQLFEECQYKVVLFYNKGPVYASQREAAVKEFIDLLQKIKGRYTNEYFNSCAAQREKFIQESRKPELRSCIQELLSLLICDIDEILNSRHSERVELTKLKRHVNELIMRVDGQTESLGFMDNLKSKLFLIRDRIENIDSQRMKKELESLKQAIQKLKNPSVDWTKLWYKIASVMSTIFKAAGILMQTNSKWSELGKVFCSAGELMDTTQKEISS
ncbi:uncharacterized protein LOC106063507 [Biomphalaria glabrata]|uniref:Uncharacterized protein LOC106063507 n=1 Tax=Biomphalaria glabrata TaxID=6526 RepID=A0A9U8E8N3_BIOGL|nr:uncharacterized protein LOC106063507 [Biomphalaria glabrata]XP_013077355.2 uncharacterized protein LOC106063507 [Biomphalaria glabrata]